MNSWVAGAGRSPAGPGCTSLGRSLPCVGLAVLGDLLEMGKKRWVNELCIINVQYSSVPGTERKW